MRAELAQHLSRIDRLYNEIVQSVPNEVRFLDFRSDLAGLLVVSIASAFENCVKETLYRYAAGHSPAFEVYARNQYEKLNSRIGIPDLFKYAKTCGPALHLTFSNDFRKSRSRVNYLTGKDIEAVYRQILAWRHDYAHAGIQSTTVEEAFQSFRFGSLVVRTFDESFCKHCP